MLAIFTTATGTEAATCIMVKGEGEMASVHQYVGF